MSRPPLLEIRSPSVWKAMLSPVRVELAELLRCNGESTIAQLARMLGRSPETLYRHVDILVKAGLVVEKGFRKKGRHVERVFDLAADDYHLAFQGRGTQADNEIVIDTMACFARVFERTVKRAATNRLFEFEAQPRNVLIRYEMSWLTREDVARLHHLVGQVKEIMDQGRKNRQGDVYRWLAVLCPFPPQEQPTDSVVDSKSQRPRNPSTRRASPRAARSTQDQASIPTNDLPTPPRKEPS